MVKQYAIRLLLLSLAGGASISISKAQVLTLKDAVQTALSNYASIKAKNNYLNASKSNVTAAQRDALPDFTLSAQQDYGTINGTTGPLYGYRGLSVASSGPALAHQNWNSAFGALYLANINWDFYAFGKAKEKIKVYQQAVARDASDLEQEKFQQEVRVAGAYLNLLAAQRIVLSQQRNLDRAQSFQLVVTARAKSGLNAGVDSSLANAEVSNAKIALTRAIDQQQQQASELSELLGTGPATAYTLDTLFVTRIPTTAYDSAAQSQLANHPVLQFYKRRIDLSNEQAKYLRTFNYPVFSLFGVLQDRASGFDYDYGAANPGGYTHNYFDGISPTRANYLIGVGVTWNLTSPLRVKHQVASQLWTSRALQDEYELINQRLKTQESLSQTKMRNALDNYTEAPIQVKASSDAYLQKSVLYKNGLSNIVDVTQALYALNRAETDRDIAYNNVWQALLLKAASAGDFNLFISQF
ncbi:TolC family protein [Deminuibacter soli]|uniref:TolC family protein n=1 Tax=Deminuibacter soli TaxID=2291815 RepID=A0A3E1NCP4_9BACT|nr:TolC family protein [Deminuibacter soli]RFM25584.1 TolC family protein [Deminuibacter soli]